MFNISSDQEHEFERDIYSRIYRKFKNPILNYVSRSIENQDIAEEITQEIFLKAYRHKESYQEKFRLSTWLWSIAKNTVIDWKRKNRAIYEILLLNGKDPFDIEQAPDDQLDSECRMIEQEVREALINRTRSLTDMQRKVLFMRIVDQLSYVEISKKLNLTLSAAKCLFHRAKTSLSSN